MNILNEVVPSNFASLKTVINHYVYKQFFKYEWIHKSQFDWLKNGKIIYFHVKISNYLNHNFWNYIRKT